MTHLDVPYTSFRNADLLPIIIVHIFSMIKVQFSVLAVLLISLIQNNYFFDSFKDIIILNSLTYLLH